MSEPNAEGVVFEALGHEIRRKIVKALGERGPLSFTQLMAEAGVKDTGTMTFHLRKLSGLVTKNERGEYVLTELGKLAFNLLQQVAGGSAGKAEGRPKAEEAPVIAVSDIVKLEINKELLEFAKRKGKRLLVSDVVKVVVGDDVEPSLFDEVVESLKDVAVVEAPKSLVPMILAKGKDLGLVRPRDKGAGLLERLKQAAFSLASAKGVLVFSQEYEGVSELAIMVEGGLARARQERGATRCRVEIRASPTELERCNYSVRQKGGLLEVEVRGCRADVTLPPSAMKRVGVDLLGGSAQLSLPQGFGEMRISLSGGDLRLKAGELGPSSIEVEARGGMVRASASYRQFEGEASVRIALVGGLVTFDALVPTGTRVIPRAKNMGGLNIVRVDKKLERAEGAKGVVLVDSVTIGGAAVLGFRAA